MKDIEKNVETVLRGLRAAQPDASLEMRIAQALREAQPEPVAVSWFGNWSLALRIAGVMVACAVTVAIWLRSSHDERRSAVAHHAPRAQQAIAPLPPVKVAGEVKRRERSPLHRVVPTVPLSHDAAETTAHLQSFPAPPMPLTEQERLLIRLAHRDDPVQLAQLAPAPRAARYQAEKDQVSEFFTPPPPLVQPDTTFMESGGGTQ